MNWDAIGAIGEILGAIAVLITLAYLAIQIRQNTQSVATSVYESAMSGFNEVNRYISVNAELSSIVRRGSVDPSSLNEEERFRFNFVLRNYANHVYKLLRLYQQGVFPEHEWRNTVLEAVQLFAMPGFVDFKANNRYFSDLWVEMERDTRPKISAPSTSEANPETASSSSGERVERPDKVLQQTTNSSVQSAVVPFSRRALSHRCWWSSLCGVDETRFDRRRNE